MADIAGSVLGATVNGVTYDVLADADLSVTPTRIKNEGITTSGRNIRKMTKQGTNIKSCVVAVNASEIASLKAIAEGTADVPLSVKVADGSIWRSPGFIDFESVTTMDGKATLTLFPRVDWQLFAAP